MIKKGETLIEVIAALTCLVLAGLTAVTVAIQVMTTTASSREYLIAQNLAREAIEAVVNIRDTNWMLFPQDKKDCWMIIDSSTCQQNKKIIEGTSYTVERTATGLFALTVRSGNLNIQDNSDAKTQFSEFLLYVSDENIYTHTSPAQGNLLSPYPFPDFYRMVKFSKVDPTDNNDEFNQEKMKITVKVQWLQKDSVAKTYELSSVITNYEK